MDSEAIKQWAVAALEEIKAVDLVILDVHGKSSVTDYMIIASGTSSRHLKAMANSVVEVSKKSGLQPLGVEGERDAEWVLVDLGDVIVHLMLPAMRDFYQLEKLWAEVPDEAVG